MATILNFFFHSDTELIYYIVRKIRKLLELKRMFIDNIMVTTISDDNKLMFWLF